MEKLIRVWCAVIVGVVVPVCLGGCNWQPLRLQDDTGPVALIMVGYDGGVLGTFGDPPPAALATLAERLEYARGVIGDIDVDCDPHDGRVLVTSTASSWPGPPYGDSPKTIVWRDWLSTEDPVELDGIPRRFVSATFMELMKYDPEWTGMRCVVDLTDVSKEYVVPNDLDDLALRPDGRWLGFTETELFSGTLGNGTFLIERRMPFLSTSGMNTSAVTWVPGERYVLIRSTPPRELRDVPGSRNVTVLLDWERWELVGQPEEMWLHCDNAIVVDGEPVFLAKQHGSHNRWQYAVVSDDGGLVWSDWRLALPWLYDPQYVSPEGGLILSRQNSRLLLYPGASPRLRVSTLSPLSDRRDLMKMSFQSVAGWLTVPVEEAP